MHENISSLVNTAAELTDEGFDAHLARTLKSETMASTLRVRMTRDYDHAGLFPIETALAKIDQDKQFFKDLPEYTPNIPALLHGIRYYVDHKIEELFFIDNDLPTARIKHNLLEHFIATTRALLKEKELLDTPTEDALDDLLVAHQVATLSYLELRATLIEQTLGAYGSVLDLARAVAINKNGDKKYKPSPEEISHQAENILRQLLDEEFGMEFSGETTIHPCLLFCAAEAKRLALTIAKKEKGDDAAPVLLEATANEHYKRMMAEITQRCAARPATDVFAGIYDYLESIHNETHGVPKDFHTLIAKAASKAQTTAARALPRRSSEYMREQRKYWSLGREHLSNLSADIGTPPRIQKNTAGAAAKISDRIVTAPHTVALTETFDQLASIHAEEVLLECDEPALLLYMQDYLAAFSKSLAASLQEKGCPTLEFKQQCDALIEKYAHAYQSYWFASEWCLENSQDAYDNFGIQALMQVSALRGKPVPALTSKDQELVPILADETFIEACGEYGIPPDWCDAFVPLLYDWCAHRIIDTNVIRGKSEYPFFSDKVNGTLNKTQTKKLQRASNAEIDQAERATLELLGKVIAQFPTYDDSQSKKSPTRKRGEKAVEEPAVATDINTASPNITAPKLKEVATFFEQAPTRGRAH